MKTSAFKIILGGIITTVGMVASGVFGGRLIGSGLAEGIIETEDKTLEASGLKLVDISNDEETEDSEETEE